MRALRPAAASMRKLSRHRRTFRPVLRFLRPRARARAGPADLVAAVAAGSARAAGRGADRRHLVGVYAPNQIKSEPDLPPTFRGDGLWERGGSWLTCGSAALHIQHRSCGVRGCDGRTMRTPGVAVGPPAATARARAGTRCRPRVRASIAALRRRGPQGRGPRAGRLGPEGRRCDARRPAGDSASRRRQTDRQPCGEYRWPPHLVGRLPPAPSARGPQWTERGRVGRISDCQRWRMWGCRIR